MNGQAVGSGGFVETLQSLGNGAVQGTDIPDLPPAPGDFPAKSLVVQLKRNASDLLATAITAAPTELFTTEQICVPEPGSYPAGLAGIAGLAALRRARRRSSAPWTSTVDCCPFP